MESFCTILDHSLISHWTTTGTVAFQNNAAGKGLKNQKKKKKNKQPCKEQ